MREIVCVYAAGLLQGLALVTFPAASAVLTSPSGYGLSSGANTGRCSCPRPSWRWPRRCSAPGSARRWGQKRVLVVGLAANLSSMALLVGSQFVMHTHAAAFALLLGATACMGIGFGLTVPAINVLAASLFPRRVDVAVLALNALLGLGTALAPVLVALFVGPRCLVGAAARRRRVAAGAHDLEPVPAARGGRRRSGGAGRALAPLLAVRRVRALLRRGRDDERQLGDPLHEGRPARGSQPGCAHAHAVLGGGDRGPAAVRRGRALAPRPPHLWPAALGHRARVRRDRAGPVLEAGARNGRVRPGGAGLLGAAAADHQPRPQGRVAGLFSSPAISSATASPPSASCRCTPARV